jgi:hypothetical protein
MRTESFHDEAEACRLQAALFAGRPEAQFLMHVACSFEQLAVTAASPPRNSVSSRTAARAWPAGDQSADTP